MGYLNLAHALYGVDRGDPGRKSPRNISECVAARAAPSSAVLALGQSSRRK
jgi:hypothetical protein